jgi:hypothetical protein
LWFWLKKLNKQQALFSCKEKRVGSSFQDDNLTSQSQMKIPTVQKKNRKVLNRRAYEAVESVLSFLGILGMVALMVVSLSETWVIIIPLVVSLVVLVLYILKGIDIISDSH